MSKSNQLMRGLVALAKGIAILFGFKPNSMLVLNKELRVIRMKNFLLEQQQSERIAILTSFINSNPEARELKRALAVKMALQGEAYSNITKLLGMHKSWITTWKQKFEAQGLNGIKLGYKGAQSYLTSEQRQQTINWLSTRDYWNLEELVRYLDQKYGVIYQSKQSYYELLSTRT